MANLTDQMNGYPQGTPKMGVSKVPTKKAEIGRENELKIAILGFRKNPVVCVLIFSGTGVFGYLDKQICEKWPFCEKTLIFGLCVHL